MSLYRTLLEAEGEVNGVIDTEDSGAPELKEIEDVVGNFDANEYEQTEAQDADFGSSDDPAEGEALLDEMMLVIAESQMWDNEIMQSIGIMEVNAIYEGRTIIYENAITDTFEKLRKWVVKFFKKVWQVLQRYFANLSAVFRTNSSFLKKYGNKLAEGYSAYKGNKGPDNKIKAYSFSGFLSALSGDADTKIQSLIWGAGMKNTYNTLKSGSDGGSWKDVDEEGVESKLKGVRGSVCGNAGDIDKGEFKGKLMNYFHTGKANEDDGKDESNLPTGEQVKTALGDSTKKAVKKAKEYLDKSKREMKDQINKLKDLENSLKKKDYKDDENAKTAGENKMKGVSAYRQYMQGYLQMTQTYRAAFLTAARQYVNQARICGNAYIMALNKSDKKYKGFQDESAGFLSNVDLV